MRLNIFSSGHDNKASLTLKDYPDLNKLCEKHKDSPLAKKMHDLSKNNSFLLEKFQNYLTQWDRMGLRRKWFIQDPEGVQTLFSTRLIYPIVGFREDSPHIAPSLRSISGKIHMMVQGKYVGVADKIKERFTFSSDGGGSLVEKKSGEKWTYLGIKGLEPIDRWQHPSFEPVVQLGKGQMNQLRNYVQEDLKIQLDDKTCFIQLVTNPRDLCIEPKGVREKLKKNYKKNFPLHASIRLIDNDGKVYSTGFGSTHEEDKKQEKMGYFSTINGMPTILDYEEFRPHQGRITTTFAIHKERFTRVLDTIERDRRNTVRFNIASQNCNTLALRYLHLAAAPFGSIKMKVKDVLFSVFPDKPFKISCRIPRFVRLSAAKVGAFFFKVISHIVSLVFINPYLVIHGGWNRGSDLIERKDPLLPTDLSMMKKGSLKWYENAFEKEIDFSLKTIEKQLSTEKGATWVHAYRDRPCMSIIPAKSKKAYRMEKKSFNDLKKLYLPGSYPKRISKKQDARPSAA